MRNYRSCDPVADMFLLQIDPVAGDTISNLKLQKLCYYGQAWSLALRDTTIFSDPIEAWAHGPAIPSLYKRFRSYGSSAIDPMNTVSNPLRELDAETRELIETVWDRYGKFSGTQLRNMTHREGPWRLARAGTPEGEMCHNEITHDSMRDFYRQVLEAARHGSADSRTADTAADISTRPR